MNLDNFTRFYDKTTGKWVKLNDIAPEGSVARAEFHFLQAVHEYKHPAPRGHDLLAKLKREALNYAEAVAKNAVVAPEKKP